MRAVFSLSLVALLATTPAAAQIGEAVSTEQPSNPTMVIAPTFEPPELTQIQEPVSVAELLLKPGALPPVHVDEPLPDPAPAPVSTTGKVAIVAGVIVVVLGVLVALAISNQG